MIAAMAALVMFAACKKDKDQTTQDKIAGKWNISREIYKEGFAGSPVFSDTTIGQAGDYFNFRTDGMAEVNYDGDKEILPYKLQGDTAILFSTTNLFKIITLTSTQLVLHEKRTLSGSNYIEETFELKR